jgi:hypothetical protein
MTNHTFADHTNYISFQDPDYAPGAIDREAQARNNLYQTQQVAVDNLNQLVKKYNLGNSWKVDTSPSICGTFIMHDHTKDKKNGGFKTTVGKLKCNLWVVGRYEDLVLTLEGVSLSDEDKKMCLSRMNFLLPNIYFLSVQSDEKFKSVSFHFAAPSSYGDSVKFKNLKKVFEFIKKEVPFKT